MITISLTTIIAGAVVVILAVLGSLVNPFLRSLRFPEQEFPVADSSENADDEATESNASQISSREKQVPITVLITAHDNLQELERNLSSMLPNIKSSWFAKAPMEKLKTI